MSDQEKARAQAERQMRDIHGAGGKRDWLARVDEELAYSGIKEKLKWITTEVYLVIVIVSAAVVATFVTTATNSPVYGLFAGIFTVIIYRAIIGVMANARDQKTEAIMLQFMNIVDNFSRTSDDLINIFEKASRYIEEPLSSQIYDAVISAKNTGDTMQALQDLQDKVKNKHFKVLIRNLEISSRFETNYSEIIEDCRQTFHDYLQSEKEKRSIRANGILEIGTMLLCGAFCIGVLTSIADSSNIIELLLAGGFTGKALLVFLIFAIIASLYIAVFQILRKEG
jgi:Flp pilus assembly protein TadB